MTTDPVTSPLASMASSYGLPDNALPDGFETKCLTCGFRFGEHSRVNCPNVNDKGVLDLTGHGRDGRRFVSAAMHPGKAAPSEAMDDISASILSVLNSHPPYYEYDREEIFCDACGRHTGYYVDHLHTQLMKVINLMGFAASMGKLIEQATEVKPVADDDGSISVDGMVFDFGGL